MLLKGLTVIPPYGHIYMGNSRRGDDGFGPNLCIYIFSFFMNVCPDDEWKIEEWMGVRRLMLVEGKGMYTLYRATTE